MSEKFSEIEKIFELIDVEVKKAVDEYKKSDPKLEQEIDAIFSLSVGYENMTAKIIKLIMKYAKHPKRALNIIPSLQTTTKDLMTTKVNYNRAKKFPHIYPYNLPALEQQHRNLKQLWNEKVSKLILIADVSMRVEVSMWRAMSESGIFGGSVPL